MKKPNRYDSARMAIFAELDTLTAEQVAEIAELVFQLAEERRWEPRKRAKKP